MRIFKSKTNWFLIPLLLLVMGSGLARIFRVSIPLWDNTRFCVGICNKLCQYEIIKPLLLPLNSWDILPIFILLSILILWFTGSEYDYRRHLSSNKCYKQVFRALIKTKFEHRIIPGALVAMLVTYLAWRTESYIVFRCLLVLLSTLTLIGVWYVVTCLNQIYNLRKQEARITWSQIALLTAFGLWIIVVICSLNLQKENPMDTAIIGVVGAVLGWIFQDTIKSVAAFFYLRANGLLQIGDLISVPSKDIEGFVRNISLTTVTIENWDTTTSSFPTYILHSEHFKNSQRMMDGKTLGRLMKKTFIIDSGWIYPLTQQNVERLKKELDLNDYVVKKIVKIGALNIEAFRLYLYHWLMEHPHVSQQPRLMVRWLQQTEEGMPLQLFAYLTDTMLDVFEWRQSEIIEHVIKAMGWFDLCLYRSPSGYDVSNSNIFLTNHRADYHKKDEDNGRIK